MSAVTHPRFRPRSGGRGSTWWSKAWARTVEEAAYAGEDLRAGKALARRGAVGHIVVSEGRFVAPVDEGDDTFTVEGALERLDDEAMAMLVDVVAAGAGRIASLLAGDLPHPFVEAVEESGVELLPFAGELSWSCSCSAWMDPCRHALAVGTQVGWLVAADPFALILMRGLGRDELLARLQALGTVEDQSASAGVDDLDTGLDAALRAARILEVAADPDRAIDHLV
ncbi:SWIM zinc finger family protein [Nocardioides sp. LHG3406-4]|uniref:SWIM zinc finger family protein n=1 Tax=Nocardioides sp. LHG3406-4 TaxID=2804575 RepID=UPI003CEBAE1A